MRGPQSRRMSWYRFYYHEGHEEHEGNQSTNRVHAQSLLNALQLDKEWVLHQNVHAGSTVEENVLVSNRLCKLQMKGNIVETQFMCQAWFVG